MPLVDLITSADPLIRHRPLEREVEGQSRAALELEAAALDAFRRSAPNLYERVRACFFLYALYRFHLPPLMAAGENDWPDQRRRGCRKAHQARL